MVGAEGTEWGFEALRQTLVLAPAEGSAVHAVTALDTSPARRAGFDSAYWVDRIVEEATTARDAAHDGTCSVLIARPQAGRSGKPASVVVGLDGAVPARAALATTDELAARLGAIVDVVSATGDESARPDSAWGDKVDTWDPEHPVAAFVERSRVADLIVVGSRSLHGLRALGSISERVAHRARCSVLVVHQPSPAGATASDI